LGRRQRAIALEVVMRSLMSPRMRFIIDYKECRDRLWIAFLLVALCSPDSESSASDMAGTSLQIRRIFQQAR